MIRHAVNKIAWKCLQKVDNTEINTKQNNLKLSIYLKEINFRVD